ncbi:MAG: amidohydrolase [Actinomycetes bacterium]
MSTPRFADLVIHGPIYRGDAVRGWSAGMAVAGDRIVALGSHRELKDLVGPQTRVVDASNKLVVAGFQDAHVHAPFAGRNRLHLFLNDIAGRENYLAAIKAYADANPDKPWIIGGGWSMEYFPGGTPLKEDLDAIVPDRPVFLFNRDVHGAWVNSKALEIGGITAATPDPSDGRIERNADGSPQGMLHEGSAYKYNDTYVPLPEREEWEAAILNAQEFLHALGITGWQDAWVTPGTLDAYKSLAESGQLTARVVGALWWDRYRELEQIPEFLEQRERATVGNFHPTTVKIMTDGVLENYTGALLQPYCDGCGGHTDNVGLAYVDRELLAAAVTALSGEGFQVHMHTIGDRAVRNALDAAQAARDVHGAHDLRHHLAHIQIVQPEDIPRFRALDVIANCQAYWAHLEPQMTELTVPFIGQDRLDIQYPFGSLLRNGAVLAMGSDWSVSTADPLRQMDVAVHRIGPDYRELPAFLPDERISLADALSGFTNGTAYVNHDEHDAGSLEVGKRADLAIIDRDIFAHDGGYISDAKVEFTVAAGRVVYDTLEG